MQFTCGGEYPMPEILALPFPGGYLYINPRAPTTTSSFSDREPRADSREPPTEQQTPPPQKPMHTPTVSHSHWLRFQRECERLGLSFVRAGNLATCGLAPDDNTTHAIVVAQTGGAYWHRLERARQVDAALDRAEHPLDTMTRRMAGRLRRLLGEACDSVHFPFDEHPVDFVSVARALGMGQPSRLRILIHPRFGLWFAFRMLFRVRDVEGVLPPSPALEEHPCTSCDAPCIRACPAGAIHGPAGEEQLDYPASFRYRISHPDVCRDACAARLACPVGTEFRYSDAFLAHSHRRAFAVGRRYFEAQDE